MRKILHIDMDAFFASVEQRDFPELQGKPVVVGGKPGSRGVVAACSYEARKFGVHSAMPSARAAKLCKEAIFVKPRFEAYKAASHDINEVFKRYAREIEPLSLDEAYLDVTEKANKLGSATEVAARIKQEIQESTQLTASAGVSFNKFLAKIASDMDKPDGLYVIRPELAEGFIEQLEIRKFFGVGKVTEKKMQRLGIYTGADLKKLTKLELQSYFGRSAEYYYNIARGIDHRPVRSHRVRKSVGAETTFESNVMDKTVVWQTLQALSERVENSLKAKNMVARTITLKVRYADFTLNTRSKTHDAFLANKEDMLALLPSLLKKTEIGTQPIRLVGMSVSNLCLQADKPTQQGVVPPQTGQQLGLF